ncbi:hypothetical protein DFJ58DRAFT_739641 [Suillus subalutaceus]|uniref:uncharacterized protein n=1 Tax=Suillus subalutaceus TaxID=48586 RepID=UPI001B867805|nr:uncharacterized protein DFJ58DRAFT_739641 [Suillus subalutaceus]KAG1817027.1 hypothetical protein DFJ58DRAFT_739641 [Suillus subalutaceus]
MRQRKQRLLVPQQRVKKACNLPASKGVSRSAIPRASKRKESNEGSAVIAKHGPPQKKDAPSMIDDVFLADEPYISDYKPSGDSEADTDVEAAETDDNLEGPESIIKFLSAETPKFVLTSEAERRDFPLTQPTWPCTSQKTLSKSTVATKTKIQFYTRGHTSAKSHSARDRKRANETPVWVDDSKNVEELKAASDDDDNPKSPNDNFLVDNDNNDEHRGHFEEPKLVRRADAGKLKLMDQDSETRCVVQRAILEAKVHMTFVNGYPDITEKNQFTRDALLTAARTCGITPIYDRLKTNNSLMLECLLFRTELKDDACAQVTAYYHLGPDCVDTAKALLASHAYHYTQHFDEKNDPTPQAMKPYSADIIPYLMKGRYFNGSNGLRVTIPMVALTSTSVYAALLWKSSKSPSKFNFTGNQFSKVYAFHVNFLNEMEENVPSKFHKLMADIFEAIQKLCSNGATAVASHKDVMAFLDLDGMDNDE